jgi:hypothetical protein
MSNELERRLKALETRVSTAIPCRHKLPILDDPTDDEIDGMEEILSECPNCKTPKFGFPRMLIFHWYRGGKFHRNRVGAARENGA